MIDPTMQNHHKELARIENAMAIVAYHIERHIREQGQSPFTVIFERLERERDMLVTF